MVLRFGFFTLRCTPSPTNRHKGLFILVNEHRSDIVWHCVLIQSPHLAWWPRIVFVDNVCSLITSIRSKYSTSRLMMGICWARLGGNSCIRLMIGHVLGIFTHEEKWVPKGSPFAMSSWKSLTLSLDSSFNQLLLSTLTYLSELITFGVLIYWLLLEVVEGRISARWSVLVGLDGCRSEGGKNVRKFGRSRLVFWPWNLTSRQMIWRLLLSILGRVCCRVCLIAREKVQIELFVNGGRVWRVSRWLVVTGLTTAAKTQLLQR